MHAGSINSTKTAAGRVYAVLRAAGGAWVDGWELTQRARTTAVSTRVSEIRLQLDAQPDRGERVEYRRRGKSNEYRIVVMTAGQGELFGECA